ncbi:L,D-transpeptidase [Synergistes jonesii]|uniref:L,D-transpeptidase n=1 Tax=Synergistes jonesii TaxID=2754 RepID=UPI00242F3C87|nr:L,D-transpeptidase [Synergistes jonesii]
MKKLFAAIFALVLLCAPHDACAAPQTWLKIVKGEHLLYVMRGDKELEKFAVAVGKNSGDKRKKGDCRTPEGIFSVKQVQDARSWSHDFHDGMGPIQGAYGPWFIRLKTGWSGIGIHGTHDPLSIGKNVTEGCIRLANDDLDRLNKEYVTTGMKVVVVK